LISVTLFLKTLTPAAKSMGCDSRPMLFGFESENVAQIIRKPQDRAIGLMITIGKADERAWPKPGRLPQIDAVINNHF
jgi:nitroreductase